MVPIDLISCLVTDELTRHSERLLERRREQAKFRVPQRTLDNFDFTFNPKMNRSLVFDLATCAFITKREDAPVSRAGRHAQESSGPSHRPSRHPTGYRVLYRETQMLLDDLADAVAAGTRKEFMESLTTVPLLITDDFWHCAAAAAAATRPTIPAAGSALRMYPCIAVPAAQVRSVYTPGV